MTGKPDCMICHGSGEQPSGQPCPCTIPHLIPAIRNFRCNVCGRVFKRWKDGKKEGDWRFDLPIVRPLPGEPAEITLCPSCRRKVFDTMVEDRRKEEARTEFERNLTARIMDEDDFEKGLKEVLQEWDYSEQNWSRKFLRWMRKLSLRIRNFLREIK